MQQQISQELVFVYVALTGVLSAAGGMGVFYWAVIGRFGKEFASRSFVETEFAKVDRTMEGLDARAKANADKGNTTAARLDVLTERVSGQGTTLANVHDSITQLTTKVEKLAEGQATTTAGIQGLTAAIEQLRQDLRK